MMDSVVKKLRILKHKLSKQTRIQLLLTFCQIVLIQSASYLSHLVLSLIFIPFGRYASLTSMFHTTAFLLSLPIWLVYNTIAALITGVIVAFVVVEPSRIWDFAFTFYLIHFMFSSFFSTFSFRFLLFNILFFSISTITGLVYARKLASKEVFIQHSPNEEGV
ncbi:hypothetical protein P9112_007936 [Eukaryota sp. TZLM1-RC]